MLTMSPSVPFDGPASIGAGPLEGMLAFIDEGNRPAAVEMLSSPGVGLSCIKMRNDLKTAAGAMCSLDGFGPAQNAGRRAATLDFGRVTRNEGAAAAILAAATQTRTHMRLARLPIPFMAVEFKNGRLEELKSYVRADRLNERFDDGYIVADRPRSFEQVIPVLRACCECLESKRFEEASGILQTMIDRGALLELVGLDCNHNGSNDIKLYFSPQPNEERAGFELANAIDVVDAALAACGLESNLPAASDYVRSMLDVGMPCNLVAVGFKGDGRMETKIYFDAWDTSVDRNPMDIDRTNVEQAIRQTYAAAEMALPRESLSSFIDRMSANSLVMDTAALDILSGQRSAKVYVRSGMDRGYGVSINGACA